MGIRFTSFVLSSAFVASAGFAQTSVTLTDQATVEASLGSFLVEDFQDEAVGPLDQFFVSFFNGFSTAANGTSTFDSDYEIDEEFAGSTDLELDLFLDGTGGFIQSVTIDFGRTIDTFAAEFKSIDPEGISFAFDNGDVVLVEPFGALPSNGSGYLSFFSAGGFSEVTISVADGITDGFDIDNVVTGNVPSPGAGALLAFAGVAAARRRR